MDPTLAFGSYSVLKKLLGCIARTFRVIAIISRLIFGTAVFPPGEWPVMPIRNCDRIVSPVWWAGERGQLARWRCLPRQLPPTW